MKELQMSNNRFIKRMKSKPETRALLELYVGIIIFSAVFLMVGIIFIRPRLLFGLGVIMGAVCAIFQAYGIYDTLDRALSQDKGNAQKFAMLKSIVRLLLSFAFMIISIIVSKAMFAGVIFGLLSLKLSGVFNPVIKKRIMSEPEYHKHDLL